MHENSVCSHLSRYLCMLVVLNSSREFRLAARHPHHARKGVDSGSQSGAKGDKASTISGIPTSLNYLQSCYPTDQYAPVNCADISSWFPGPSSARSVTRLLNDVVSLPPDHAIRSAPNPTQAPHEQVTLNFLPCPRTVNVRGHPSEIHGSWRIHAEVYSRRGEAGRVPMFTTL